ncbi:MAG: DNA-binding protein [Candidatus Nealsonbacteria bacterium CG03_land_8_20_14_0_80_36_12]|uniref:DNA-binding protein n=1 Tax=Candidatus Nealsonbacteria bacterium CG03_land_8_20_14_0_80_36_12 TaxID=1974701 RepID=A0A2M7BY40_9BACT|nr:MAG: DNA-binding protein [Candidatus Nealsonbacteria bacterium CG03_land_8_20_14_0_80_36_12]
MSSKIGEKIRRIRQQKKMSQDRLSKKADLALNTIVKIETGENPNPTLETLRKIAKALDVSLDQLLKNKTE